MQVKGQEHMELIVCQYMQITKFFTQQGVP